MIDAVERRRTPAIYYLLFAISGFAGLIYESIWTHYLQLFLGHAAYAQVLVISIYMSGMAIGAYVVSAMAVRISNPIFFYALAESVIGLMGLLFHDVFVWVDNRAFTHWLPVITAPHWLEVLKWTLAAMLILPQSILLGATFPLLASGLARKFPQSSGRSIAVLYFANSFGASIGVLLNGFVFVKYLGLPGAISIAACVNITLAFVFYRLSRNDDLPVKEPVQHRAYGLQLRLLLFVAAFTGAASFMYEIAWIRMLSMVFGASTHAFELMLSTFILGLSIGSFAVKFVLQRLHEPKLLLAVIQIIMGMLALCTLPLYNQFFAFVIELQAVLNIQATDYWKYNILCYGLAMLMMLPATICAGATLPLITYTLMKESASDKSIGQVYAANTLGSIIGVVIAVQVLMPLLGLKWLLITGAITDFLLGGLLLKSLGGVNVARRTLFVGAAASACVLIIFTTQLDRLKMGSGVFRGEKIFDPESTEILFHRDGKTSTVQVVDQHGYYSISNNGKTEAALLVKGRPVDKPTADESTMTLLAALPFLHRADIESVANIGFGSGLTAHNLLHSARLQRLDNIEIEKMVIEGARLFGQRVSKAYEDERSHFIVDDAKTAFVKQKRVYDAIVSEPPNPWVSGVSSLFTIEFYTLVRHFLNDEGVFVQWLHLYHIDSNILSSIYQALSAVFPHIKVYQISEYDIALVAAEKSIDDLSDEIFTMEDFKQALNHVDVASLSDMEARELSNAATIDTYFRREAVPANSDYYPYVDNRAARVRFTRSNVNTLLLLQNATIANRIVATNPIVPSHTLRESINFKVATSVKRGAYFMQAYNSLTTNRGVGSEIPRYVRDSATRLYQIIHTCSEGPNVKGDFRHITVDFHKYIPDAYLMKVFNDASISECASLKEEATQKWIDMNSAWLKADYLAVLALTNQWNDAGKGIGSYSESIELKLFLASTYLAEAATQQELAVILENYRRFEKNDPEIGLLLIYLQQLAGNGQAAISPVIGE